MQPVCSWPSWFLTGMTTLLVGLNNVDVAAQCDSVEAAVPAKIVPDPQAPLWRGHAEAIRQVGFFPDGQRAFSVAWDGTARVWEVATGKAALVLQEPFAKDKALNGAALAAKAKVLAIAGSAHKLYLWDMGNQKPLGRFSLPKPSVTAVALSPDEQNVYVGGQEGELRRFKAFDKEPLNSWPIFKKSLTAILPLPGGLQVVCASWADPAIVLWDMNKGAEVRRFQGPDDGPIRLALFADGQRFASTHGDGTVRIWSLKTGEELDKIDAHCGKATRATSVHVLHQDRWLLTTGEDKAIRIWDVKTLNLVHEMKTKTWATSWTDVSPDGRLLLTGGGWALTSKLQRDGDYDLRLWRLPLPAK